jgi:hypothetical protein
MAEIVIKIIMNMGGGNHCEWSSAIPASASPQDNFAFPDLPA